MEILKFCFYIFDKDKSGEIEEDEMHTLIETLQQGEAYSNTKQALLGAFDEDGDGKMNFKEFVSLDEKFPQMLYVRGVHDFPFPHPNNALTILCFKINIISAPLWYFSLHLNYKTQSPSIRWEETGGSIGEACLRANERRKS